MCYAPNCAECDLSSNYKCSVCKAGFILHSNGFDSKCVEDCSKTVVGCAYCSEGRCQDCQIGYVQKDDGCVKSIDCPDYQAFNKTSGLCQNCTIPNCVKCHFDVQHVSVPVFFDYNSTNSTNSTTTTTNTTTTTTNNTTTNSTGSTTNPYPYPTNNSSVYFVNQTVHVEYCPTCVG